MHFKSFKLHLKKHWLIVSLNPFVKKHFYESTNVFVNIAI